METFGAAVMDDDLKRQQALAAAGYTGRGGTILFCLLLAVLGAMFGSIALAILWSFAIPTNTVAENTILGTASGVALGVWIGLTKIRRGNLEAREAVDDNEWRRLLRRRVGETRRP